MLTETLNLPLHSNNTHRQPRLSAETVKCIITLNWESLLALISLLSGTSTSTDSTHSVGITKVFDSRLCFKRKMSRCFESGPIQTAMRRFYYHNIHKYTTRLIKKFFSITCCVTSNILLSQDSLNSCRLHKKNWQTEIWKTVLLLSEEGKQNWACSVEQK